MHEKIDFFVGGSWAFFQTSTYKWDRTVSMKYMYSRARDGTIS